MEAVRVHRFGGVESLRVESLSAPAPSATEVLVRVRGAGVNPYDWMTREGSGADVSLPWIPGWDLSGTVDVVGSDVRAFDVGAEVFAMLADQRGTYAEYVAVPAANLVPKPEATTHVEAAGVPMVALTAWQALFDAGRLRPNQRVLIHAAAGGVGHVAVQLANWVGAETVGTASGANRAYLDTLGLDEFVNYREQRFEEVVDPVDLVVDAVGGETFVRSLDVLAPDGHVVTLPRPLTDAESELLTERGVSGSYPVVQWRPEQLRSVVGLLDDGRLDVRVDSVFPLDDVVSAHERSESGHARGKVILEP
ncbi:NADP-dependent oxidoreductase [Salinigranum salinum]|uniref:NADP-dependent oxidoreductase n=1 Tax=Salinigranum salinum TaxID=1364937 RepID=UPI001260DB53|nr:NADP-dependent oxidoreductase [Salinigranum salinum]